MALLLFFFNSSIVALESLGIYNSVLPASCNVRSFKTLTNNNSHLHNNMAVNNENERFLNIEVICPSESTKTFCKIMSNQCPGKVTISRKVGSEVLRLIQ